MGLVGYWVTRQWNRGVKDCKNIGDLLPDIFLSSLKIVKAISAGEWQRFSFWPRAD